MKRKVLIVDDNSANLYMLESLMKGYGLDVITAGMPWIRPVSTLLT